MKGLFKRLGHGFLFILVLPIWLITFVFFGVYAIISYIFTFFSAIPAYFRGESIFGPSELDIAASTRLAEQKLQAQMPPPAPVVQPSTTIIFNTPPQGQVDKRINYIEQNGTIYRQVSTHDPDKLPTDVIIEEEKK